MMVRLVHIGLLILLTPALLVVLLIGGTCWAFLKLVDYWQRP